MLHLRLSNLALVQVFRVDEIHPHRRCCHAGALQPSCRKRCGFLLFVLARLEGSSSQLFGTSKLNTVFDVCADD